MSSTAQPSDQLEDYFHRDTTQISRRDHFMILKRIEEFLKSLSTEDNPSDFIASCQSMIDRLTALAFNISDSQEPHMIQNLSLSIIHTICQRKPCQEYFARKWLDLAMKCIESSIECDVRVFPKDKREEPSNKVSFVNARLCVDILLSITRSVEAHKYFTDFGTLARFLRYSSDIAGQIKSCEVINSVCRTNRGAADTLIPILGSAVVEAIIAQPMTLGYRSSFASLIQGISSKSIEEKGVNNSSLCVIGLRNIFLPPILSTEKETEKALWFTKTAHEGRPMNAFFGKTMVVLDWEGDPNLSIPYKSIRSIKMNRNGEVVIRLRDVPFLLLEIYERLAVDLEKRSVNSADIVHLLDSHGYPEYYEKTTDNTFIPEVVLNASQGEFHKMKEASIYQWIAAEMTLAKKELTGNSQSSDVVAIDKPKSQQQKADLSSQVSQSDPPLVSPSSNLDSSMNEMPIRTPVSQSQVSSIPSHGSFPEPLSAESTGEEYRQSTLYHRTPSSSTTDNAPPSVTSTATPFGRTPIGTPRYESEMDPLFDELKRVVTQKVNARHQEGSVILEQAQHRIQREIESYLKRREERYQKLRQMTRSQVQNMQHAQEDLERRMSGLITKLNTDVSTLAQQNELMKEQFRTAELDVDHKIDDIERHQVDQIARIHREIDAKFSEISEKIHDAVASTNPLKCMTQVLSQSDAALPLMSPQLDFRTPEHFRK